MSNILNKSIAKLMKGYPTVADKYDVAGGVLASDAAAIEPGALLVFTAESGVYTPAVAASTVDNIAGIALAQNVKLTDIWSSTASKTLTQPGEAVNLCIRGLVAVDVGATVAAAVKPGAKVGLTGGALVVAGDTNAIPNWYFTGCVEGTLAEIDIRR